MNRRDRPKLATCSVAAVCLAGIAGGCSTVPLKRFQDADRIDVTVNPGWFEFDEPFASHFAHLKAMHEPSCRDLGFVRAVYEIVQKYPDKWVEYWAIPPDSPPVSLTFHTGSQWLGTLEVYESALGHVGNKIHRIEKQDADRILELIGECAETGGADTSG
jgi:hypothetical protein